VRGHDELGVLVSRDGDADGWRQPALGTPAIEDLPNGADMDGVAFERFDERLLELGGAYRIEQLQQPSRGGPDLDAPLGNHTKKSLAARSRLGEPVEAAMLTSPSLFLGESLDVLSLLDLLTAVPRSSVTRDDLASVQNAHRFEIGEDDESTGGCGREGRSSR